MKHEIIFDAVKYINHLIKRTKAGELTWRAVSWATSAGEQDGSKMHVVHGYRASDKGRRLDLCLDPVERKHYSLSVSVDKIGEEVQPYTTQSWASTGLTGGVVTDLYNTVVNVNFADLMEDIDDADGEVDESSPEDGETPYKDRPDITTQQLRRALWFALGCTFVLGVLCGHFLWK
jgi:hypothetical protein